MDIAGFPDDPVALRSPAMCRFFAGVMRRQMASSFRAVRLLRPGVPQIEAAPLVVFSNHPGWWDPVFFMVLQGLLFENRQGYGPMEAEALRRYAFMRRIGIFGVETGGRSGAVRFLQIGQHLLSDPGRMIWMTAQGRFADPRERPAKLRSGLAHLLARQPRAIALPLALEYPFWTEKRPEALAAFGAPLRGSADLARWQSDLEASLEDTQQRLAKGAMTRDPEAFETVLAGRRGVGGIYGVWSRGRDAVLGRGHGPDHVSE